jgi:hypothetical protein
MAEDTGLDAPITAVTVFKDGARAAERHGERGAGAAAHSDRQPARNDGSGLGSDRGPGRDLVLLNVEMHRRYRAEPLRDETA